MHTTALDMATATAVSGPAGPERDDVVAEVLRQVVHDGGWTLTVLTGSSIRHAGFPARVVDVVDARSRQARDLLIHMGGGIWNRHLLVVDDVADLPAANREPLTRILRVLRGTGLTVVLACETGELTAAEQANVAHVVPGGHPLSTHRA
ncbi:hypothetical protein [Isoptericola croceus]|uniref:hypothetical protein n=1 Tax=Isoptericola croceus TaxID=3031406 RepID=UPI0023F6F7D2|nr:hypothetical protein [Isoptericola croceus]